jgi:hypothetical protein
LKGNSYAIHAGDGNTFVCGYCPVTSIKKNIEERAAELSTVNATVRKDLKAGITLRQLCGREKKHWYKSERVGNRVQDRAVKLDEVNKTLEQEIDYHNKRQSELREITEKLSVAERTLSDAAATGFTYFAIRFLKRLL